MRDDIAAFDPADRKSTAFFADHLEPASSNDLFADACAERVPQAIQFGRDSPDTVLFIPAPRKSVQNALRLAQEGHRDGKRALIGSIVSGLQVAGVPRADAIAVLSALGVKLPASGPAMREYLYMQARAALAMAPPEGISQRGWTTRVFAWFAQEWSIASGKHDDADRAYGAHEFGNAYADWLKRKERDSAD